MGWTDRAHRIRQVLKFTCFYPTALLFVLQCEVYFEEKQRIQGYLHLKHQEYIQDNQKAIDKTGEALHQFTQVTVFPPLEEIKAITTRRSLRERCISNGISPQLYNEFYRLVESTEKGVLLNELLAKECEAHKEKCEGFAVVAQLLLL